MAIVFSADATWGVKLQDSRGQWRVRIIWLLLLCSTATLLGCSPNAVSPATDTAATISPTVTAEPVVTPPRPSAKIATEPTSLAKAIQFLMAQQADDGGFKSTHYGSLRGGAATTSLVVYAMSHVEPQQREPYQDQLQKAWVFLQPGIEKKSTIATADGSLDFPLYGSAMVFVAAKRLKLDADDEQIDQLLEFVVQTQLTETLDIPHDSEQHGGWDLEASSGATGDAIKGSNISITSFALEALAESMHPDAAIAQKYARAWLAGAQNKDGGFVFHPWQAHPGNKAMWTDEDHTQARSYGTATCDGLRCLIYCGEPDDSASVASAISWLEQHPQVVNVPGFTDDASETGWSEGLRYYYYFTLAKCLKLLPQDEAQSRAVKLRATLDKLQKENGSFQNDQPRMYEDDPLIATSFAVVALALSNH